MRNIFKSKKINEAFNGKIKFIVVVLVTVFIFSSLFVPSRVARAQFITSDLGQTVANLFHIPNDIYKKISNLLSDAQKKFAKVAFKQALSKLVHNIAYDSATYLVTGDKGQSPMFQTNFGDYIKKEGDAFLGDALNNQLKNMWGVNLCEPLDPFFKLRFQINIKNTLRHKPPSCTFSKMMKNIRDMRKLKVVDLPKVADMFNPNSNELGAYFTLTSQLQDEQKKKEELAKLNLKVNNGFKAVKGKVSGQIKTPAIFNQLLGTEPFKWSFQEKSTFTGDLTADFVGTFTNTLLNKLLSKYKQGLFNGGGGNSSSHFSDLNSSSEGASGILGNSPIQAAKERFASLAKFNYNFGGSFDLLNELACNKQAEGVTSQYNCVIDDAFKTALSSAPYLTVREAITKGLLHADWPFGYRVDKSGGIDPANKNIYAYRNLIILRKYRVIPVGWELAAQYYALYDKSGRALTLKRLLDDYDNPHSPYYRLVDPNWVLKAPKIICQRKGPGELTSKDTIKIPVDKNKDGAISENEYINLPIRLPYCADERSCIKENADGSDCLYYGYCTEDKPIWRIDSDTGECHALYNSCRVYKTRDGQQVAYLSNTLWGKDVCSLANVGCREYSKVKDSSGNWLTDDGSDLIYLNRQASDRSCSADQVGCNRFIRLKVGAIFKTDINGNDRDYQTALNDLQAVSDSNNDGSPDGDGVNNVGEGFTDIINYDSSSRVNLKKPPTYLNCEEYTQLMDYNNESDCQSNGGLWRTDIDRCVAGGNSECKNYILYCNQDDNNCQFYNPQSYSGPKVPGVVSSDDQCPAECVGYKTYLEQPSFLDRNSRNVNFIPKTAQVCSAVDNGCEEFTNLSEGTEGENKEYFSTIRSCVLPNNSNVATYYSWASTDESGNQLKTWQLLKSNQGEYPCTNTNTAANGEVSCVDGGDNPIYQCHFGDPDPRFNPIYNPDCVEFVAESGTSYWMLNSRVVVTSEDCVPMRRTKTGEIFSINKKESKICNSHSVGCREYKGSTANNVKIILNDNFEDGTSQAWDGGQPSAESLAAGGHSLFADNSSHRISKQVSVHSGNSYNLSFWAKNRTSATDGISQIYFKGIGEAQFNSVQDLHLNTNWNRYEVNLNNLPADLGDDISLVIEWDDGSGLYIDNIVLTETQDDLYLIQDSWQTPDSCIQIVDGRDMLNCEAYNTSTKQKKYLRSFNHLCRDEIVGCEAMIDTYNNSTSTQLIYNNTVNSNPDDDVVVPADKLVYMVYSKDKLCNQPGCVALGQVKLDGNGVSKTDNKYFVVDAQTFDVQASVNGSESSPLCLVEENGCDEFKLKNGGSEYFFDPGSFVCDYRQVKGNYAWYKLGTNLLCPTLNGSDSTIKGHCLGGRAKDNNNDNFCQQASDCSDYANASKYGNCSQWVGLCPVSEDECTEYQDPSNPINCDKQAVYGMDNACDYYYYKANKVKTCAESELGKGCQAFHQTDGGDNLYYSVSRCTGDVQRQCETDSDCIDENGQNLGNCSYIAPKITPEQSEQPPLEINGSVEESNGATL